LWRFNPEVSTCPFYAIKGAPCSDSKAERGKPPAQAWTDLPKVLALAAYPNVAIKITGACTLAHDPFPYKDIWDPLGRIFEAYSFDRCLWGTDWTRAVKLLTYKEGVEAFRVTDRLSDGDRAKLMGGTASRIYGWSPSKA
jgi:L-fuconolactonase